MEKQFRLKEDGTLDMAMLQFMHPAIVLIIAWTNLWCVSNRINPVWTSWMRTEEENKALGATNVHIWRAADLSIRNEHGWNKTRIKAYEAALRRRFDKLGAFSPTRGASGVRRRVLIRHDSGHGDHFHIQVNPYASVEDVK